MQIDPLSAYRGRKKALSEAAIQELHQRLAAGVSKAQVAREFGISREMLYQYLKMMAWQVLSHGESVIPFAKP